MSEIVIGIDPGPTYTGVSVTEDNQLILSTTYKNVTEMAPITWAVHVVEIVHQEIVSQYPDALIGIEGVTPPGSHLNGKVSLMNPKHLIRLSFVVGAFAQKYQHAAIVKAGKNGSGTFYPPELEGRRPKDLPGNAVGTRNHERSAYDVNRQTAKLLREGYKLDTQKSIFDVK